LPDIHNRALDWLAGLVKHATANANNLTLGAAFPSRDSCQIHIPVGLLVDGIKRTLRIIRCRRQGACSRITGKHAGGYARTRSYEISARHFVFLIHVFFPGEDLIIY
jgi:hypothetical protein